MKVEIYAQGEIPQRQQSKVFGWLKNERFKQETLWLNIQCQDDLIRELMARQDRQGKWIVFLLLAWVLSVVFMWFGVLVTV